MSAFMTCNKQMEAFGNQLVRFLRMKMCGHNTRTLLDKVWPYSPWAKHYSHSRDDHLPYQVGRLCRLMLLMNRRAVWHRYTLGRTGPSRHDAPHWAYTRVGQLKGVPADAFTLIMCASQHSGLTEPQRLAMAKYLSCTVYQCSEYSNDQPRLLVLLNEFERTIDSDVLHSLKTWDTAPWGDLL
ncbi:hypothetical protein GL270_21745 [Aeromonas veronii]|uniref:hypothetical protein n=1 Tax=Aeromonas veronii TaxID=654 RepID=UPI001C5BB7A8|nr:hypothetical protein [Aeromonas veronii]MBW3783821.1 hypothetical protein [Aeromonas veronii]